MFKSNFPIFQNNPWLVYLDNAASTQKPQYVIDGVSDFVSKYYANIHRWNYWLSEKSEWFYHKSKELVAQFLWCKASEIIYGYNATQLINLIAQSLCNCWKLKKWDTVLLWIRDHHANILPRQILAETYGFQIRFINIDKNYDIDREDFEKKYDETVKVVACWHVSNVTWTIYDVKKIKSKLNENTFFLVDGSQSVPNFPVDVNQIQCDCLVFTGHKMMAYTGIWAMYLKKEWIKLLKPLISWWGAIEDVDTTWYKLPTTLEKFEAWTPNIIWAISLLKSLEYIKSIGWMSAIRKHEQELVNYIISKAWSLPAGRHGMKHKAFSIIGSLDPSKRVWVFSFVIPSKPNFNEIGEKFDEDKICIRCGWHCAYPLHKYLGISGTCRMSIYIYNDKQDIDKFFDCLEKMIAS